MNRIANDEPTPIFAFTGRETDKAVDLQANLCRRFGSRKGDTHNRR